jgi:hypothetical protein
VRVVLELPADLPSNKSKGKHIVLWRHFTHLMLFLDGFGSARAQQTSCLLVKFDHGLAPALARLGECIVPTGWLANLQRSTAPTTPTFDSISICS